MVHTLTHLSSHAGSFSQAITFAAVTANQIINVPVPIADNNIALEDDLERVFRLTELTNPSVPLGTPNTTLVRIQDDDSKSDTNDVMLCFMPSHSLVLLPTQLSG